MDIENSIARVMLVWRFIVCPNEDCKKFTLRVLLWKSRLEQADRMSKEKIVGDKPLYSWDLIPPSDAKVLPDYVPKPIVQDYEQACAIKSLSPKASATLARRCLQGMIRDFWSIKKDRLIDEIKALEEKVNGEIWKAIDAVRSMGNIGAHMQTDINVIVDVNPEEAGILVGLIETLIDDWYVARHDHQQRVAKVIALGKAKQEQRKPTTPET